MYKQIVGFLFIIILTSSIYVMMPESVRIDIQPTKSIFKVWENDKWEMSGIEWVNLFDGTKKMRAKHREVINYTKGEYEIIKRNVVYKDNITMNETYVFLSTSDNVELFPVEHEIIVNNGQGKILQYDVTNLLYIGETVKGIESPQSFGRNMKVEWDIGNYYSKIYKYKYKDEGKLTIKYKIENDTAIYNVRLFDPVGWWNSTWNKRKPIDINVSQNVTDYQFFINLTYDSDMQPNGSDLRVTCYDNMLGTETETSYWVESKSDSNYFNLWFNCSANTYNGTQGHVYYDNSSLVTSQSNLTAVFWWSDTAENGVYTDSWTFIQVGGGAAGYNANHPKRGINNLDMNVTGGIGNGAWVYRNVSDTVGDSKINATYIYDWYDNNVASENNMMELNGQVRAADVSTGIIVRIGIHDGVSTTNYTYYDVAAAGWVITDISVSQGFHKIEVKVFNGNYTMFIDDIYCGTFTYTTTEPKFVYFGGAGGGISNSKGYYDDIRIRKFIYPEPTYSIGAEEEPPQSDLPIVDEDGDVGKYSSVDVDSSGYVHISYKDSTNNKIKYCNDSTGSFVCENVAGTGAVSTVSVIVIDSNDIEHIIYTNGTDFNLSICNNSGGSWNCVDIDGLYGYRHASADIDSNDIIHISCADINAYNLTYCNNTGGNWSCEIIDGSVNSIGLDTSLIADSNDIVHISHHDNTDNDLRYCNNSGGSWSCEIVDSIGNVGSDTSIDVDSNDNIHISYLDATNSNLKYCNNFNDMWNCEIVDTEHLCGYDTSIGIDSVDNVYIVHFDWDNTTVRYCNDTNGTWECSILYDIGGIRAYTKGKALAIYDEFDYSWFYTTFYHAGDADLYMDNFSFETCPFNITYYDYSDYLEYIILDINGTYQAVGQSEETPVIEVYSLTDNICSLNINVDTNMESCVTFWISNDNSLDRATDYNITSTSQTIIEDFNNNTVVLSQTVSDSLYTLWHAFIYAQSFMFERDKTIKDVGVYVKYNSGGNVSDIVEISIQTDNGGEPSGNKLANFSYDYNELNNMTGIVYKELNEIVYLDSDTYYYIVIDPEFVNGITSDYDIYVSSTNIYGDGTAFVNSGTWISYSDNDFTFGMKGNYTEEFWSWIELNECPTSGELEYDINYNAY